MVEEERLPRSPDTVLQIEANRNGFGCRTWLPGTIDERYPLPRLRGKFGDFREPRRAFNMQDPTQDGLTPVPIDETPYVLRLRSCPKSRLAGSRSRSLGNWKKSVTQGKFGAGRVCPRHFSRALRYPGMRNNPVAFTWRWSASCCFMSWELRGDADLRLPERAECSSHEKILASLLRILLGVPIVACSRAGCSFLSMGTTLKGRSVGLRRRDLRDILYCGRLSGPGTGFSGDAAASMRYCSQSACCCPGFFDAPCPKRRNG